MMGLVFVFVIGGLGILLTILAAKAIRQWQGMWRWTMVLPILLMVGVTLNVVIGVTLDPTSHNLWPFELLLWYIVAGMVIGLLVLLYWISHRIARARESN